MMRLFKPAKPAHLALQNIKKLFTQNIHHQAKRRLKFEYQNNRSIALKLDVPSSTLNQWHDDSKILLEVSKEQIKEHAARRVDLFFYTLVAYYKSNLTPVKRYTDLQNGIGRSAYNGLNITQACHSSFFGGFEDNITTKKGLLDGTQFYNNLNSTVELPAFVNKLDDALEEACRGRQKSLEILQTVAHGYMDPTQGLQEFLGIMAEVFQCVDVGHKEKNVPYNIRSELFALQRHGTFYNKWLVTKQMVNPEYIETLLRLTPEEKQYCQTSEEHRKECYQKKFADIKKEILFAQKLEIGSPKAY